MMQAYIKTYREGLPKPKFSRKRSWRSHKTTGDLFRSQGAVRRHYWTDLQLRAGEMKLSNHQSRHGQTFLDAQMPAAR
jgi:hypothetical protein